MSRLFALFPHDRGPIEPYQVLAAGELREWPALWSSDPRFAALLGEETRALLSSAPGVSRYFASFDPNYPGVPLIRTDAGTGAPPAHDASDQRVPPGTGARDKFWQRLVVEASGHLPQPGFACVTGDRIGARNAPRVVRVDALDCRTAESDLRAAAVPGAVVAVEGIDTGFVALGSGDGVRVVSRSSHVARLRGSSEILSREQWNQFVSAVCARPLPLGVTKTAHNPTANLGEALACAPDSYILKPRFGSNGFGVVRVVSHPDARLTVDTDCPDTARYLEEFPHDPDLRGRDLVAAVARHRGRYIDRATAGLPEQTLDQSVLEAEIGQDRADGSFYEPRVVVQRVSADRFATLGALCKRIDTAIGASVARDFREEPLDAALHRFLAERVRSSDLAAEVRRARDELLTAADALRAVVVPLVEARGARVHQFGIDSRLCWNAITKRAEFPFIEFQFGIGRIDLPAVSLDGYKTRAELVRLFGPEFG